MRERERDLVVSDAILGDFSATHFHPTEWAGGSGHMVELCMHTCTYFVSDNLTSIVPD